MYKYVFVIFSISSYEAELLPPFCVIMIFKCCIWYFGFVKRLWSITINYAWNGITSILQCVDVFDFELEFRFFNAVGILRSKENCNSKIKWMIIVLFSCPEMKYQVQKCSAIRSEQFENWHFSWAFKLCNKRYTNTDEL